jgi:hypothetical protein
MVVLGVAVGLVFGYVLMGTAHAVRTGRARAASCNRPADGLLMPLILLRPLRAGLRDRRSRPLQARRVSDEYVIIPLPSPPAAARWPRMSAPPAWPPQAMTWAGRMAGATKGASSRGLMMQQGASSARWMGQQRGRGLLATAKARWSAGQRSTATRSALMATR